jgi:hypothetical protein
MGSCDADGIENGRWAGSASSWGGRAAGQAEVDAGGLGRGGGFMLMALVPDGGAGAARPLKCFGGCWGAQQMWADERALPLLGLGAAGDWRLRQDRLCAQSHGL